MRSAAYSLQRWQNELIKPAPWNHIKILKRNSCLPISQLDGASDLSPFHLLKCTVGGQKSSVLTAVGPNKDPLRTAIIST